MRTTILTLAGLLLGAGLAAQTVFIPDVQFRAALNAIAPGAVDVDGYLDDIVAATPMSLDLTVDWTPCDLTGIEAFTGASELWITFSAPGPVTWDAMPPNVWLLVINGYPGTALPPFPHQAVEITVQEAPDLLSVPPVPDGATSLFLLGTTALTSAPVLPPSLYWFDTDGYPASAPWPTIHPGTSVMVRHSQHSDLPTPSENILELNVLDMPQLTGSLPALASNVFEVVIDSTGLETIELTTTDGFEFVIRNNPALTSIVCGPGVSEIIVQNTPALISFTVNEGLTALSLSDVPALTTVSGSSSVFGGLSLVGAASLTALPSFTTFPATQALTIWDAPLTELPELPAGLVHLDLRNTAVDALPALPDGLTHLVVEDAPLACLPLLPEGLTEFSVAGTPVTCMPNHPPSAPQSLPLCTILNTYCPEINPYVAGTVFRDDNVNGAHDAGEPAIANAVVRAEPSGYMTGTDSEGRYSLGLPVGAHTITVETEIPYVLSITPEQHTINATSATDVFADRNFALEVDTVVPDLHVDVSMGPAVPGFYPHMWIPIGNTGTTVHDVQLRLTYDPALTFMASSHPPTDTVPMLVWDLDSLAIGGDTTVEVLFQLAPTTPLGTLLNGTAEIRPTDEDVDLTNNSVAYSEVVVGSYDPNDKRVFPASLHPDTVAAGTRVDYVIRFQNTGTFPAQRVLITDTISAGLQLETFRFEMASHPCTWFIREGAIHFVFDDIMLPDSTTDEPGSHGLVRFSMMPSTSLMNGESVSNEANIYFDFNEPVITEPAILVIDLTTAERSTEAPSVAVYPVPTHATLNVRYDADLIGGTARLMDALGREVLRAPLRDGSVVLDLTTFTSGAYILRLENGEQAVRVNVVKQ